MYDTILFDLDGTLTDPGLGITNSVMYALEKLGYPVPPREALYKFIGPPLHQSFRVWYGMTEEQSLEAVAKFREYFSVEGLKENRVYDGIPEMLTALEQAGKRLVLATSKPEKFARIIMAHYGLDKWIRDIAGATMDTSRSRKADVIAYALERFGVDPKTAIMVGDREHDIHGAAELGLSAIGITWGYGDRAELEAAGAQAVFDTPGETVQYILRGSF